MSEHIYAFTIEGLGKTSAVSVSADDRLWRFATGTPAAAADTNGLYKPWLRKGSADTALRIAPIRQRLDYQTGKYTIDGKFVRYGNGQVHLLRKDGKSISIPWKRLSLKDQRHVANIRLRNSGLEKIAEQEIPFQFDQPEKLRDSSGQHQMQGTYIGIADGHYVIWDQDGKELRLSPSELDQATRDLIRSIIKQRNQ